MDSGVVERLRAHATYGYMPRRMREVAEEAADALEAQAARIAALEGELKEAREELAAALAFERRLMNDLQAHKDALAQSEPFGRQSELRPGFYEDDIP